MTPTQLFGWLVPTVNICDRTWAVREAILAATPNRDDTCEAVSALEMWAITELDFTGIYVHDLKNGDFEDLPALNRLDLSGQPLFYRIFDEDDPDGYGVAHDVFAPLENLVELDLSGTDLWQLPRGMFDGLTGLRTLLIADSGHSDHGDGGTSPIQHRHVFRDLANLRVLDLRPDEDDPLDASPLAFLPLTSLETYNGRPYAQPPGMPENLSYTIVSTPGQDGAHTVTLTWDAPAGESGVTGYRVLRNTEDRRPYKCRQNGRVKTCDYDYDRYAHEIGQTGAGTTTLEDVVVWGDWNHYYVEAITADGDSLPADLRVNIP